MKRLLLYMFFFMMGFSLCAQELNNKTFEFPIKPHDGKWETITSIGQRLEMLQIPSEKLLEMPTSELLDVCLDFPYLIDVFLSDDYQLGFDCLKKEFNGYNELLQRDDLLNTIIIKSRTLASEIEEIQIRDLSERGYFSFKWFVLEMIAAQDDLIREKNSSYIKQLIDISIDNLTLKGMYPDIFSDLNSIPTYLLFAKTIKYSDIRIDNETSERLEHFINSPSFLDSATIKDIDKIIERK